LGGGLALFINAELSQLPVGDGRQAVRRIVNLAAALRESGAKTEPVLVVDISSGGFKAEVGDDVHEGSEVWLKLPGYEAKRSKVIWRRDNLAGCEFESPMHQRDLDLIISPAPRKIVKGVFGRT
jgi:hypothetical protein